MAEKVQVNADKLKVLSAVMDKIEKDFGKGSIMRMSSENVADVPVIPSGSITLDMALGVGGYPKGRVIEIFGPESSGKTTLAIHAIAEAQKAGGIAAFIDAEHAFDSYYAQKLGVDVDNLLVSQPDNGEQALEIADSLIRSSAIDIIVIDSVAALTPKAEIEGDMGDSKMGLQARLMSQALRKLTASISKTKTVCIFINQLRDKIGVVYGNPETTTGGNALKFYASVRIDIRRTSVIKDGEEQLGTRTRVKIVKNRTDRSVKGRIIQANVDNSLFKGIRRHDLYFYIFGFDRVFRGKYNYIFGKFDFFTQDLAPVLSPSNSSVIPQSKSISLQMVEFFLNDFSVQMGIADKNIGLFSVVGLNHHSSPCYCTELRYSPGVLSVSFLNRREKYWGLSKQRSSLQLLSNILHPCASLLFLFSQLRKHSDL